MTSKVLILCSAILLIQEISAQYLNYGNVQNLAPNNLASNLYGANNLGATALGANNLAANVATNNIVSSTSNSLAGSNLALGNNLGPIISNNVIGQNYDNAVNLATNIATNNAFNVANVASPITTTAGLFEGISAANGGVFSVTSSSPIIPTGLSVYSDNLLIEGPLTVSGQLPFLSSVAVEGTVPSSGQGLAGCGCGDGTIGIVNEVNNAGLYGGLGRPGLGRFY